MEPHIHNDHDITASLEAMGAQHQEEPATYSLESIPIPQALHAVYFPCFQIGEFENKESRKRPTSKTRKHRGHLDEIPTNQQRQTFQPLGIADPYVIPVVVSKTETQATMQVGTQSRSKRIVAQNNLPALEETKKPKHDEQQKRYAKRMP